MIAITNRLLDDALSLPVEERIQLVEGLLHSLNSPRSAEVEREWQEEVEKRLTQMDNGEVEGIPYEVVKDRICELLKK